MSTATRSAARKRSPKPARVGGADPGEPPRTTAAKRHGVPGQIVLVLQGGGALGAYQVGVYQALHEAGIEPDWVIGTSIGAINAALICRQRARKSDLNACTHFWGQRRAEALRRERVRVRPRFQLGMLGER